MSGRHHHYLPQFIQRPFAYRRKGPRFYVHAHHRTRGTYSPNTQGLGQELDFYGGPGDTALDDAITDLESGLAATVREINEGAPVPAADMALLISALAMRTKSMRAAMVDLLPPMLAILRSRLMDNNRLRRDLVASLTDPKERRRLIYDQIRKNMGPLSREQRARVYGTLLPRWKTFVAQQQDQLVADARRMAAELLAMLRNKADEIANAAYLEALARDPAMTHRAQQMAQELSFAVLQSPPGEFFILGDCGPVSVYSDGKPRLLLGALDSDVQLDAVLLPVSPNRCVIAHRSPELAVLTTSEINRISASLSLEFFVSDQQDGLDSLRNLIGSLAPFETEQQILEKFID